MINNGAVSQTRLSRDADAPVLDIGGGVDGHARPADLLETGRARCDHALAAVAVGQAVRDRTDLAERATKIRDSRRSVYDENRARMYSERTSFVGRSEGQS